MKDFVFPGLVNLRRELPWRDWEIGRRSVTNYITIHYNGPALDAARQSGAGLIGQLRADIDWQTKPGWGNTKNGADGLQYHFVAAADGTIFQTRDLDASLWHCGHRIGNPGSIAIHFPLGKNKVTGVFQDATAIQWSRAVALIETLRVVYGIGRGKVVGHKEWKSTECPGPLLMARLNGYRAGVLPIVPVVGVPVGLRRFQVVSSIALMVRQGPSTGYSVAGKLAPGQTFLVDVLKQGETVEGTSAWAHMAYVAHEQTDLGFLSMRWLKEVA